MSSKIVIPNLAAFYRLDDVPTYDSHTSKCNIIQIPGDKSDKLNGTNCLKYDYKGEEYIRLGSPRSGFLARVKFITQSAAPLANDRAADITLEANWFHHLFSKYEIKAQSETLESIDKPGEAIDILYHLRGLDFRQRSGENSGFIPDGR